MISRRQAEGWQLDGNSAEAYEEYFGAAFRPFAADLVRLAAVAGGDRVLDVALWNRHRRPGGGGSCRRDRPGGGSGCQRGDASRRDRSVGRTFGRRIEWRQGNAMSLPFTDAAFDVVTCEQALAFFSDPVAALAEMRRVLGRGGRAVGERVPSARVQPDLHRPG